MTISRKTIISTAQSQLEQNPRVLALWLEGADATGHVDPYSDIDLACSVEAGTMEAITAQMQAALEGLGTLDIIDKSTSQKDFQFSVFHLEGTSPYLLIDFNVFVKRGSQFVEGDEIEKPLVLFDRGGVVKFSKPDERLASIQRTARLRELADTVSQYSRIEKYIKRKNFLEAFGYYHKWLLTPLIEVLRMCLRRCMRITTSCISRGTSQRTCCVNWKAYSRSARWTTSKPKAARPALFLRRQRQS